MTDLAKLNSSEFEQRMKAMLFEPEFSDRRDRLRALSLTVQRPPMVDETLAILDCTNEEFVAYVALIRALSAWKGRTILPDDVPGFPVDVVAVLHDVTGATLSFSFTRWPDEGRMLS